MTDSHSVNDKPSLDSSARGRYSTQSGHLSLAKLTLSEPYDLRLSSALERCLERCIQRRVAEPKHTAR
jgi:hypothetical protein